MKKTLVIIICLFICLSFSGCNSTKYLFDFQLYDKINFNGVIYRRTSNDNMPENFDNTDFNLPVYIIDDKNVTRKDRVYYAAEIVGDKEHKYLFFDSAPFVRSDSSD